MLAENLRNESHSLEKHKCSQVDSGGAFLESKSKGVIRPQATRFLTKSQLEELYYSPQRQNAIKNEAKHHRGRAKYVLEAYKFAQTGCLGKPHLPLSPLRIALGKRNQGRECSGQGQQMGQGEG